MLLGYAAGESWRRIHHLAGRGALYLLLGAALLAALALGIRLLRRRRARAARAADLSDASPARDHSDDHDHSPTRS